MNYLDGSLFPEKHEKLVITCAPYGPEWMPSDFPEDIAPRASSVALIASRPPDRAEILADAIAALDRDLALAAARGLGLVHARLSAADALRGARVRSESGAGLDQGRAEGIDVDGRLLVRRDDGVLTRWAAGEVHLVA